MKVLVVYGTTEGHTRTIAERIGEWIDERGDNSYVADSANIWPGLDIAGFDAYILAGSLHVEKHQASLAHFVQANRDALQSKPSAFLSVSLTASQDDEESQAAARRCMKVFTDQTGWTPTESTPVAGALLYTEYDFLKRFLLKMISKKQGGPTDTSQDYVFTDWEKLKAFVSGFLDRSVAQSQEERMAPSLSGL